MQPDHRNRKLSKLRSDLITIGLVLLSLASFAIGAVSLAKQLDYQPLVLGAGQVQSAPTTAVVDQSPTYSQPESSAAPNPSPYRTAVHQTTPKPTLPPGPGPTGLLPNELGEIIILEYHVVGDEEGRWSRTRSNFRDDLETIYEQGYRLISILDYLDNNINLEAGVTPIIITFDDSNHSQFQLVIGPDGDWVADPDTAVGIFEQFIKDHPDFGHSLAFSILPGADPPNDLFGQEELTDAQLNYLVEQGHVIASHTLWHADLSGLSKADVEEQLGRAQELVHSSVPGYRMRVLTLPFGAYPEELEWAKSGTYNGTDYHHEMILKVGANPAPAPSHVNFDPDFTPRVQATQDELDRVLGKFAKHPEQRYVSDGDPETLSFPKELEPKLDRIAAGTMNLNPY